MYTFAAKEGNLRAGDNGASDASVKCAVVAPKPSRETQSILLPAETDTRRNRMQCSTVERGYRADTTLH